ncbi:MAG TPA: M20/M25/M40 family metallo-hydrolase, partial [Pyrinomonadaceae bacterium]|nr:M20/M25/M40 family metallo-hydrolase [Pyrinomonadaceae bacterium]
GECRFTLEWRPVPNQDPEHVVNLIEEEIARLRADDESFECEINVTRLDGGIETPADSRIVRAMEDLTGESAGAVAFGTEAPQMKQLGAEPVVFGPGDIRVAHRTGEFVPVEELRQCVSILAQMIERFCVRE